MAKRAPHNVSRGRHSPNQSGELAPQTKVGPVACPVTGSIFCSTSTTHTACTCGHCLECDHPEPPTKQKHFRTRAGDTTPRMFPVLNRERYCTAPICDCLRFERAN